MSVEQRNFLGARGLWPLPAILLAALFFAAPASAQERVIPPDALKPRPRVPIYDPGSPVAKKILRNGVTILVQEQRTRQNRR